MVVIGLAPYFELIFTFVVFLEFGDVVELGAILTRIMSFKPIRVIKRGPIHLVNVNGSSTCIGVFHFFFVFIKVRRTWQPILLGIKDILRLAHFLMNLLSVIIAAVTRIYLPYILLLI